MVLRGLTTDLSEFRMEGGHWNLEDPSERIWPVQERDFDDFLGDSLISSSAHRDGEG